MKRLRYPKPPTTGRRVLVPGRRKAAPHAWAAKHAAILAARR